MDTLKPMTDQFGRQIDYMRMSITDRCNLRCKYCMPHGVELAQHSDMLRYEELLRIAAIAAKLGISKFKITGGEPLIRRGCCGFIAQLKALDGVQEVTLTTNALLLNDCIDELAECGIDGVNISLDAMSEALYSKLCGAPSGSLTKVLSAIKECEKRKIRTKINTVLLEENFSEISAIASLAESASIDVRFIELMPIGSGEMASKITAEAALSKLREKYPDLKPSGEKRGNGPAIYYKSTALKGQIGLISAMSHKFCSSCNRVRITANGTLKPCLCYSSGISLRDALRRGVADEQLSEIIKKNIYTKPLAHSFDAPELITEQKSMNKIGG